MAGSKAKPTKLLHLSVLNFLFSMEGEAAASAGDPVSSNPYIDGTLESDLWLAGWTERSASLRYREPMVLPEGYPPRPRPAADPASRGLLPGAKFSRRA